MATRPRPVQATHGSPASPDVRRMRRPKLVRTSGMSTTAAADGYDASTRSATRAQFDPLGVLT
jgi:hypothetical protein